MARFLASGITGLALAAVVAKSSLFVVMPGECAVKFDRIRGILPEPYHEGLHWLVPVLQTRTLFEVRMRPREVMTKTGTKDQQTIQVKLRVLHRPDPKFLPWLLDKYGTDYDDRILPSLSHEILKSVIAQYNAEELITLREEVSKKVRDRMRERAKNEYHLRLDDIALVDLRFSAEFMHAVEMKQVAQQEAEKFKYVVERNEQEKLAAIIRAEGEAEAASLISSALAKAGPGLIAVRRIEAQREIADTLANAPNVHYLPHTTNMLLNLGAAPS